jgi:hypothetical protein
MKQSQVSELQSTICFVGAMLAHGGIVVVLSVATLALLIQTRLNERIERKEKQA